jgi:hypothetical protein
VAQAPVALDRPGNRRRRQHNSAKAGVGVDEAAVRSDDCQVDLRRPGPEQQHIAGQEPAFDFIEAGIACTLELGREVVLAQGVWDNRRRRRTDRLEGSDNQPDAIEPRPGIASPKAKGCADEALCSPDK